VKLEEQNRNQISFGAGISEFEGFFGQASFQTSNFLGRGESLTVSLSAGSRAQNYTLAFVEPFLFDRNMTGSINLFRNDIRYIGQFTQRSAGGVVGFGYPLGGFTRLFTNYSYERTRVTEINQLYTDPLVLARNPFLQDSLLIGAHGERIISKFTPSVVHNTVDQPIFPNQGVRYTAAVDLAGLGGNTKFYKPTLEGIWYWRQAPRLSLGLRALGEYIHSFGNSNSLPIFQKIFLGGEYSVRGYDIRSIGPHDTNTGLVLGGNKDLLFNVEQNFNIMSQLRVILFYDAGQVRDVGQSFVFKETLTERVVPQLPLLYDPNFDPRAFLSPKDPPTISRSVSAFKTSTGVEVRLFMPVINVPFRLIFAYNPQRAGVLASNTLLPQKAFQFRFAVGTTF
jgi:outer membrane protein insertion porin family